MKEINIPFLSESNKLIAIIVEPRYRWLRHLLLLLLLVVSYNSILITFSGNLWMIGSSVAYLSAGNFMLYMGMAYMNIYVLMPRLFMKSRYMAYFISLVVMLSLVFISGYLMEYMVSKAYPFEPGLMSYLNSEHNLWIDYVSDLSVMGMCCAGTSITLLFRNWLTEGKRRQEMETRQLRSRIDQVKTSVNSDLMSNVLATAADMIPEHGDLSADMLSRFGRFLRYKLYDSNREIVMLNSEVAFLGNYLSLVKDLRDNFTYNITNRAKAKAVPPSLLINITDIILANMKNGNPAKLDITLSDKQDNILSVKISAVCADIDCRLIAPAINEILDIACATDHNFSVIRNINECSVYVEFKTGVS